jgi:signal transduction histidine kinase
MSAARDVHEDQASNLGEGLSGTRVRVDHGAEARRRDPVRGVPQDSLDPAHLLEGQQDSLEHCFFGRRTPGFGKHQRARFEGLRRQVYDEMSATDSLSRLLHIIPFNVLIVVILAARGLSPTRLVFQVIAVLMWTALFSWQMRKSSRGGYSGMFFAMAGFFLASASTGGLASPLIVTSVPLLVGAAFLPVTERMRAALFLTYGLGCVAMALLSRTAIGQLTTPLSPTGQYASVEYIVVVAASLATTVKMIFHAGQKITVLNERLAYEIAIRREQVCSESTEQTRALEGMAARLAHEVKNPLAAIKGLSTHMARASTDPKTAERLAIVASEADRLQGIVDGFLSFSRGLDDLEITQTRPMELAREITILFETRAADQGVSLEASGDETLSVNVDARKLRQSLINLVTNALQASPTGGKVVLRVESAAERARIHVVDRGEGMAPETLERIKRPHYTTREGGSGLGIAIARGLVEQHGGELKFDSTLGRGTIVTIDLPVCARAKADAERLPQPARDAVAPLVTAQA